MDDIESLLQKYSTAYYQFNKCMTDFEDEEDELEAKYDRAYPSTTFTPEGEWKMQSISVENLVIDILSAKQSLSNRRKRCERCKNTFKEAYEQLDVYSRSLLDDHYKYNITHPDVYQVMVKLYEQIEQLKNKEIKEVLVSWGFDSKPRTNKPMINKATHSTPGTVTAVLDKQVSNIEQMKSEFKKNMQKCRS